MESKRFSINQEQLGKAVEVFLWVVASAAVSFGISVIPGIQLPVEWQWLIPFVNSGLVMLKKFLEDKNGKLI